MSDPLFMSFTIVSLALARQTSRDISVATLASGAGTVARGGRIKESFFETKTRLLNTNVRRTFQIKMSYFSNSSNPWVIFLKYNVGLSIVIVILFKPKCPYFSNHINIFFQPKYRTFQTYRSDVFKLKCRTF
jgi:hypothetical protein